MRNPFSCLALAIAATLLPVTAHADVVSIFTTSPNTAFQSEGALTGQIAIDITTGQFVSADLTIQDLSADPITVITSSTSYAPSPYSGAFLQNASWIGTPQGLNLTLSGDSLIGYTGGLFCSLADPCIPPSQDPLGLNITQFGGDPFGDPLTAGSLVLVSSYQTGIASAPEPSTLLLLATGIACAITILRRRPESA